MVRVIFLVSFEGKTHLSFGKFDDECNLLRVI